MASTGRPEGEPLAAAVRFGRFELRPVERQLLQDDRPATLGSRAFDVLQALVERHDRVVSKNELLELAWPGLVVEENNLTVQVSALRKLLGPQAISTVPGRGYRFAVPLLGETAAPAATPSVPAPALPLPALLGRDRDLATLRALLGSHRLVSVVGAGGIGKTRLAQWALRLSGHADAAWVELATCTEAAQLPAASAHAAGVQLGAGEPGQALAAALAGREMLLALDNAEHLLADVAAMVQALLQGAPGVRVLVTSQAPLHLPREAVLRLDTLAVPAAGTGFAEATQSGAVALFVRSAQAARPGFALDAGNVAAVIDLCRRLDGMPLALELAAARMGSFGVQELARLLDARLRTLKQGERGAPPRQQTLHAALDWSYGLLAEAEQRVFNRLGAFVGRFTLDGVRRVAPDDSLDEWSAIDILGTLVDRSLVMVEHGEPTRYRLLDTPRLYALERLAATGELEAMRQRHSQAMRLHFEQADARYYDGRQSIDSWIESMAHDLDDGFAAWHWAVEHDLDSALSLAACIDMAMVNAPGSRRRGLWNTTMPWFDHANVTTAVRERWLSGLIAFGRRQTVDAVWCERLYALAVAQAARGDAEQAYVALAWVLMNFGFRGQALADAQTQADDAIARMRALELPTWPPALRYLRMRAESACREMQGHHAECIDWLRHAVVLAQEAGSSRAANSARVGLMDAELAAGLIDEALHDAQITVDALRGSPAESTLACALINQASAMIATGQFVQARNVVREAWPRAERFELIGEWTDVLAWLLALEGHCEAAARLLGSRQAQAAGKILPRQINEQRAVAQAQALVRDGLGDQRTDVLLKSGVALSSKQVLHLVLGDDD